MSSGCCHPKIHLPDLASCSLSCRPASPFQGKKNLSADLITLNSASQTFVKTAAILLTLRRLSKIFLSFFSGVANSQLELIYPGPRGCQKES
jgi:hypothetical protein